MGKDTTKKGAEKAPTTEKEIERIGDIIKNARGTWFVLLGSLVFAAITLASVKDASFFITSEQTKLPLLGISVPVTSFFWAGALLIAALYTYLHLYLVQLWDALGEADAQIGEKPLADVIHPWLVSDAALRVRDKRRGDVRHRPAKRTWKNRWRRFRDRYIVPKRLCMKPFLRAQRKIYAENMPRSSRKRGMTWLSNVISVALAWGFGLIIIGWFWWRSMSAHSFVSNDWPFLGMTGWLGILLVWSLYVFWRSGSYALARLGDRERRFPARVLFIACVGIIAFFSFVRAHHDIWEGDPRINRSELADASKITNKLGLVGKWSRYALNFAQEFIRPARAEMSEFVFTQKPAGWKGQELAKQEFRLRWCKQLGKKVCAFNPLEKDAMFKVEEEKKFEEAWKQQWKATLATFTKPDLRGKRLEGADLRFAELEGIRLEKAQLQGADLSSAEMQGADLTLAKMQGAVLTFAKMQGAVLTNAEMQGAVLREAEMQGAFLWQAKMQGADLTLAKMQGADLTLAKMQGAVLRWAKMQRADLRWAKMQRADLRWAKMQRADLREAEMQGADLREAEMQGAVLREAEMQGADLRWAKMQRADLREAEMQGADLREAEMQGADLRRAEMQGTSEKVMELQSTNLSEGNFSAALLRFVDFTGADVTKLRNFKKSFGDGSVDLAGLLETPKGWCETELSDAQYWGRYLGWLAEHDLGEIYDDEITKHPLIPFSEPCPK